MTAAAIIFDGALMSDAGEGLIDADARIQERMEELERDRTAQSKQKEAKDPEKLRTLESLRLARTELQRQLETTQHEGRRAQLRHAIEEVDRRMADVAASLG
jgi:hypothetical protein